VKKRQLNNDVRISVHDECFWRSDIPIKRSWDKTKKLRYKDEQ
jgi:hypothetical protein